MNQDQIDDLKSMPVDHFRSFKMDDREFVIIDKEFLRDLAEKANIKLSKV